VPQTAAATDLNRTFHLVAIAASAGGVPALEELLGELPGDFPVPIALVLHVDPTHVSLLAPILSRKTELVVCEAKAGERLRRGVVYVAPPAHHLEIDSRGAVALTDEKPVHFLRPSADRLFQSAARAFGPIIGIVLTGTGSDGTVGARAIRAAGGVVIAQDEASSAFFGMPQAAIDAGVVDRVIPLGGIAAALEDLTQASRP
jgi:two-component system chemotaxis response regulator CheB